MKSLTRGMVPSYADRVRRLAPAALLGYWPLWEPSGATCHDESGAGRHGSYTNVTPLAAGIGDGRTCHSWPGTTAYASIYSASLNSAFNGQEFSVALWARASGSGVWTDGVARQYVRLLVDGNNVLFLRKDTTSNQSRFRYNASGTIDDVITTALGGRTDWFHIAATVSKAADQFKAYIDGAQAGSTQTGLGTWAGSLSSTGCLVGAGTTGAEFWSGTIAHVAIWSGALTADAIKELARKP